MSVLENLKRRNRLADTIEEEMRHKVQTDIDIGTGSSNMQRVHRVVDNGITHAHKATCGAVDEVVAEARRLLERIEKHAEEHKALITKNGQQLAAFSEASLQTLQRMNEQMEAQTKQLRDPRLEDEPLLALPRGADSGVVE